jgi:hypothetical protein
MVINFIKRRSREMENRSGQELNSEATAIKLMGLALEKAEKEMLREMGIQIGGICPTIEIVGQHSDWLEGVRVSMVFDIKKLNGYFNGAVQPQKKEKEL